MKQNTRANVGPMMQTNQGVDPAALRLTCLHVVMDKAVPRIVRCPA